LQGKRSSIAPSLRQVAIEEVEPGQVAWAYDPATDSWRACVVEAAFERQCEGDLVAVDAAGGAELVATGNHPFWVASDSSTPLFT
jgi:hypothetical protein